MKKYTKQNWMTDVSRMLNTTKTEDFADKIDYSKFTDWFSLSEEFMEALQKTIKIKPKPNHYEQNI